MRPEMILKKKAQDTWIAVVALLCGEYCIEDKSNVISHIAGVYTPTLLINRT